MERVRQLAITWRLLGHEVAVFAAALIVDATWDNPFAVEADDVVNVCDLRVVTYGWQLGDPIVGRVVVDLSVDATTEALDGLYHDAQRPVQTDVVAQGRDLEALLIRGRHIDGVNDFSLSGLVVFPDIIISSRAQPNRVGDVSQNKLNQTSTL